MYQEGSRGCIQETISRLSKFDPDNVYGKYLKHTSWIIGRYMHYLIEAVVHGCRIRVYHFHFGKAEIALYQTVPRELKRIEKKHYMFSTRTFEYMFYLSITGKYVSHNLFTYYIEERLRDRILEKLNSDDVYKFIRK